VITDGLDPAIHYTDDWKKLILSDKHDCFSFYVVRSAYLDVDVPAIVQRMWNAFSKRTYCRHVSCTPEELLSITPNPKTQTILAQFGSVLANLKFRPKFHVSDFIPPISADRRLRSDKDIKARFANVFGVEFSFQIDKIYFQNEDDHEKSADVRLPQLQIDPSFVPKVQVSDELQEFRENVRAQAPMLESQWTEAIFIPNKPSQMAPSTKGPMLYMPGLIRFCLTDGQENKIWLEKIAGLKRNYRVTIIIDSSYSCFSDQMFAHSVQTLFGLLRVLSQIDIPYFDFIVATAGAPKILAINQSTQRAIDFQTFELLGSLLSTLMENEY
jgi:hypothetical protein